MAVAVPIDIALVVAGGFSGAVAAVVLCAAFAIAASDVVPAPWSPERCRRLCGL